MMYTSAEKTSAIASARTVSSRILCVRYMIGRNSPSAVSRRYMGRSRTMDGMYAAAL